MDCLVVLGKIKEVELTEFCDTMAELRLANKLKSWKPNSNLPKDKGPIASPQTIRNTLIKVGKHNLIVTKGKGRKKISINPELKLQIEGNILLNYKFIHLDTNTH